MRSIAFAFDPDCYWVELVERAAAPPPGAPPPPFFSLAQTMLRMRDPTPSLDFYTKLLGMTLVRKSVADSFTVYFLATLPAGARGLPADPASGEAREYVKSVIYPAGVPVLELTHSACGGAPREAWTHPRPLSADHGTESQDGFAHFNGNEEWRRGYGHIGFLVSDVYATHAAMEKAGVAFHKTPDGGSMKGLAFAKDPDGYLVELIKRGHDGQF